MNQIDILNKLNMVNSQDPNYQPLSSTGKQQSWDVLIKAIESHNSPQAQRLAKRYRQLYNLSNINSDKKGNNVMALEEPTQTPEETPVETPKTDLPVEGN